MKLKNVFGGRSEDILTLELPLKALSRSSSLNSDLLAMESTLRITLNFIRKNIKKPKVGGHRTMEHLTL